MTYHSIELSSVHTHSLSNWNKDQIRKTAYNLFAVVALLVATGVVASAYHPADNSVSNPRFESMGLKHIPTTFRGAPPAN